LRPNEGTPARIFELPTKFGPPESPKHVPPLLALFERSSEKSPMIPPLIWCSHGVATIRGRIATSFRAQRNENLAVGVVLSV